MITPKNMPCEDGNEDAHGHARFSADTRPPSSRSASACGAEDVGSDHVGGVRRGVAEDLSGHTPGVSTTAPIA